MTKVLCFANNKGGSGKSTTCSNVAYFAAQRGKKVLVIDGDMQLNLSLAFFDEEKVLEITESGNNIYGIIKDSNMDIESCIYKTDYENIDILPSSTLMSGVEYELFTKWQREHILKKALAELKNKRKYDLILIDAPPTLGCWVMNIMCASDYCVIPVEASPWGLFGLSNMFSFLSEVNTIAENLKLLGVVVTKVDVRKRYFKQTMETLNEMKNVPLFETFIRLDSSVEWSQENSKLLGAYKKNSRAAEAYEQLTEEIFNAMKLK